MDYVKEIHKRFNFFSIFFQSCILSSIIFLLDYLDVTYIILNKPFGIYIKIIIFLTIVFSLCEAFKGKIWNLLFLRTITLFDKILFILLFSEILFLYNYIIFFSYWKTVLFLILFLNIAIIITRIVYLKTIKEKNNKKNINVHNISELYYNRITKTNNQLILLEEEAIKDDKDDLINISLFIDSIKDSLLLCNTQKTFVMSLIGKWGAGKTSIINLLKSKINNGEIAVIDTFSPWKYDNKISLFKGFYNYIFKLIGKKCGYINYKDMIKKYENVIFNVVEKTVNIPLAKDLFNVNEDEEQELEYIKNQINDNIKFNDKKIIIVIDDIDRLQKNEILFVFKMVKNIFDFDNIIYILSYDEKRIRKVFENELNIDSDYLNKIIQNKIYVPILEIDKTVDIGTTSLKNMLNIYNIKIDDEERFTKIINMVFNSFEDLREVIRFINSLSITINFLDILKLDISDYIALEYIKFRNISLYNKIYKASKYFISEDSSSDIMYEYIWAEKYNKEAESFFDDLFNNDDENKIKELLKLVFPNVEKYDSKRPIRETHFYIPTDDRINSIKNRRCYNGRFFRNYFTIRHSFYTQLNILVNKFITNINNGKNLDKEFNNIIKNVHSDNHDLLFELLDIRIKEIKNTNPIFYYVLRNILKYENKNRFLGLNSCDRAKILLSSIIENEYNEEIQKEYINSIYDKDLFLLEEVLKWLKVDKYNQNEQKERAYNYGKNKLVEKLELDMKNKVDIISTNKNYFWMFYRNIEDKEKLKKYVISLIDFQNVFKFLGMFITTYLGSEEHYAFSDENLKLFVDRERVDNILQKTNYKLNSEQEKILYLYNNSKKEINYTEKIDYNKL